MYTFYLWTSRFYGKTTYLRIRDTTVLCRVVILTSESPSMADRSIVSSTINQDCDMKSISAL